MVHNERGPATNQPSPMVENVAKGSEKSKEKPWVKRMVTGFADVVRDVDTASKMASEKFDGDSALMRTARGTVSIALGAGMEKVTDMMWDGIWNGQDSFIERFKLPQDTGKRLHNYAASATEPYYLKARFANFAKEGSQDLVIGAINNMIAFRSQPILQRVEAAHLLRSLAIDAGQAFLTPSLGKREQLKAASLGGSGHQQELSEAIASVVTESGIQVEGNNGKNIFSSLLNFSNPVTHLGVDMVWSGVAELKKNWKEVRKARKEKGIEGKAVDMSKKYEKKEWGHNNYKGDYNRNKVYYGKSKWDNKAQEEYELKADS